MNFTKREVTKAEHDKICDDFKQIDMECNIPDANTERLNVTAEEDGEVVVFASGLINHKWFYITDLWVTKKYRGQGFGAKALAMLEADAKARGIKHVYTRTSGYNSNEIFYQKQGYKICCVFEDYYEIKDGHHIFLRKELI